MIPHYDVHVLAEGQIRIATQRLAGKYPFHTKILERLSLQCRTSVSTMGVTVNGDDVLLLYNPKFVLGIPMDQLVGVLLHEVHHVLFGHVVADPADFPDVWARAVAEELTANEFIREPLPRCAIRLKSFPSLPRMESTKQRYHRLKSVRRRRKLDLPGDERGKGAGSGMGTGAGKGAEAGNGADTGMEKGTGSGTENGLGTGKGKDAGENLGKGTGAGNGSAAGIGAGTRSGTDTSTGAVPCEQGDAGSVELPGSGVGNNAAGRSKTGGHGVVLDDHRVWQEAVADRHRSEATIQAVINDAAVEAGVEHIPDYLRKAMSGMPPGTLPGDAQEMLEGRTVGQLPWIRLLRRYVGQILQIQPDFRWPPRRFPHLVGVVPGRRRLGTMPKIMAAIDTSGSMTTELLEQVSAELGRLARDFTVTVVECDVEIQKVYPFRPVKSVHGREGTDLRPPFAPKFLRKHCPDLVIYFTDGEGPAPKQPPRVPVIWALTPEGQRPAKWGRVVQISVPEPRDSARSYQNSVRLHRKPASTARKLRPSAKGMS